MPYLPDPWSRGACFVGLPGVARRHRRADRCRRHDGDRGGRAAPRSAATARRAHRRLGRARSVVEGPPAAPARRRGRWSPRVGGGLARAHGRTAQGGAGRRAHQLGAGRASPRRARRMASGDATGGVVRRRRCPVRPARPHRAALGRHAGAHRAVGARPAATAPCAGRHRAARPARARGDVDPARRRGPPARREHRSDRPRGVVDGPDRRSRSRRAERAPSGGARRTCPLATGPPRAGRRRRATVRRGAGGTLRRGRRPARARRRSGMAGRPTVHVGPRAAQHQAPARHVHGDGDVTLPRVLPAGARRRARRADAPVGAGRRRRAELVATAAARPPLCRSAVRLGAARGWQDPDHHAPRWRAAPVPRAAVAGLGRGRAARCRAVEGVDPGVPATSPRRATRHHVGVRSGVAGRVSAAGTVADELPPAGRRRRGPAAARGA